VGNNKFGAPNPPGGTKIVSPATFQSPYQGSFRVGQQLSDVPMVTLNPETFQNLLRAHGVKMVHSRPLLFPVARDLRGSDVNPQALDNQNGFWYYGHKEFTGVLMDDTRDKKLGPNGRWDFESAQIIIPTHYDDGTPMDISYEDRIQMTDSEVRYPQRVEANQGGVDQLHFEALRVDMLVDSNWRRYEQGVHFNVEGGAVVWVEGQPRPPYDASLMEGSVYSIAYYCRPAFTVVSLPHQLRRAQTQPTVGGQTKDARFPQLAVVRKDFIPTQNGGVGSAGSPNQTTGSVSGDPINTGDPTNDGPGY
jgi:hypothetical protein